MYIYIYVYKRTNKGNECKEVRKVFKEEKKMIIIMMMD